MEGSSGEFSVSSSQKQNVRIQCLLLQPGQPLSPRHFSLPFPWPTDSEFSPAAHVYGFHMTLKVIALFLSLRGQDKPDIEPCVSGLNSATSQPLTLEKSPWALIP